MENCQQYSEKLIMLAEGLLEDHEQHIVEAHLNQCEQCSKLYQFYKTASLQITTMPTPDPEPAVREDFFRMLESFKQEEKKQFGIAIWFKTWLASSSNYLKPVFASAMILIFGIVIGLMVSPARKYEAELSVVSMQVEEMKGMMFLAMLENQSANQRLKAVSIGREISNKDDKIIMALFNTLNEDDNINVRLAAADALLNLAHNPDVRAMLIKSIFEQESPLVQDALVDVLLKNQDKNSVNALKKLMEDQNTENLIKEKIAKGLNKTT